MKAGDAIADDAPLSELLAPRSVAEADATLALLESRREAANEAATVHAATRDDALIAGTESAHDAEAQRLADDARRLAVVADRIAARRAELVAAERLAEAREQVRIGREAAQRADDLTMKYASLARQIANLLSALPALFAEVEAGRRAAREHDLDVEGLVLPHERRSASEVWESHEVVEHGVRRRIDRRVQSAVVAADLTSVRIELPAIDGGAPIIRQGQDRKF